MAERRAAPDINKIRALIGVMEKRGLSQLVLTEGGVTVRLRTAPPAPAPVAAALVPNDASMPIAAATQPQAEAPAAAPEPQGTPLLSPTTGTFYRSPAPGEPPFVEVGDVVEVGQTVGIIMAMKVMSEVPAEVAGEVVAIPAHDAELVQLGTPLVIVKPADGA